MGKHDWGKGLGMLRGLMGSGSIEVPHLVQFLEARRQETVRYQTRIGIAGAICGTVAGLVGGLIAVLAAIDKVQFSGGAHAAMWLGINVLGWGAFGWFAFNERRKRLREESKFPLRKDANVVLNKLQTSLQQKRLHREVVPSGAELMDEAAKHYMRLINLLNGPFWTSDDLAEHWRTTRRQALSAADQAMDEVLVLLADAYRQDTSPGWQRVLEDLVSGYAGSPRRETNEELPRGFFAAEDIAQKLRSLAAEMERLTQKMIGETQGQVFGGTALDLCLSEVRSLQQAEHELRQQIGGPPAS